MTPAQRKAYWANISKPNKLKMQKDIRYSVELMKKERGYPPLSSTYIALFNDVFRKNGFEKNIPASLRPFRIKVEPTIGVDGNHIR